jgi:hypothetical protein
MINLGACVNQKALRAQSHQIPLRLNGFRDSWDPQTKRLLSHVHFTKLLKAKIRRQIAPK